MHDSYSVTFISLYVIAIIYYVIMGCYMMAQRANIMSTHGEQEAKLRMTRAVGIAMFIWAFDLFIYLPPALAGYLIPHPIYQLLFFISEMLATPMIYAVMFAIVQKRENTFKWVTGIGLPFLLLTIWWLIAPPSDIPFYVAATLTVASLVFLLIRFAREYYTYVRRIKTVYSETSDRDILWSWVCFFSLAVQGIIFVVYVLHWNLILEIIYGLLSIANATCLCYCTCRQRVLDIDIVEESEPEGKTEDKTENTALYATIEQKLQSLCEDKFLFLDPDLSLDTLCLRLTINHTYLGLYFQSRGTNFYQYINTLRVGYAYKLMCENDDLSIREVSEQSGFRSQTTFRKMFKEVMGCLPSEIKSKSPLPASPFRGGVEIGC